MRPMIALAAQDAWDSIQKTGYRYLKSMHEGSKTYTASAGFYASDALSCSEAASQGASGRYKLQSSFAPVTWCRQTARKSSALTASLLWLLYCMQRPSAPSENL